MNLRFEEEAKKERKKRIVKELVRYLIAVIAVIALAYFIVNYTLKKLTVIGSAMENTLISGQDVIATTFAYKIFSPGRETVIAFYPEKSGTITGSISDSNILIRRIVGLPGETIHMENGYIYADGVKIEEKYEFDRTVSSGRAESDIVLDDDEYFVLSDKRTDLDDSRSTSFTKVKKENIIGPVFMRTTPLSLVTGPNAEEEKEEETEG